jgi:hypothetical protein
MRTSKWSYSIFAMLLIAVAFEAKAQQAASPAAAPAVPGAASGDSTDKNSQSGGGACNSNICWGVLTVPFKVELTGNADVYGSAAVGTYVGFRTKWLTGFEYRPVVFVGYSQNIGTSSSGGSNTAFVSYGGGVMFPVNFTNTLEFGFVVGVDHTGESSGYQYNDKPWATALIGVNLN